MVRNNVSKREVKYINEELQQTVAVELSMSQAARKLYIPTSTLHNNTTEKHKGWVGRKTMQEEKLI